MGAKREWAKQIFQVVCVVSDLEETLANWKRMVEFNQASIKLGKTEEGTKCIYRGKEIQCPVRYARFDLGGVDLKLVEPLNKDGGDPYSDCLLQKGQGFHHVGVYTEAYEELLERYKQMDLQPSCEEITGETHYRLYDLEERMGMSIAPWSHMTGPCGVRDERGRTL